MTMTLNESEEISPDLLRPLLECVKKENQVCALHYIDFISFNFYLFIYCLVICYFTCFYFILLGSFTYFLEVGGESNYQLCCHA